MEVYIVLDNFTELYKTEFYKYDFLYAYCKIFLKTSLACEYQLIAQ